MFWNYLFRSLTRNKTRTLLVSVGIIISVMLVSGVSIASNRMASHLLVQSLDQVKVDFKVQADSDVNTTDILTKLNSTIDENKELEFAFASMFYKETQTFIKANCGNKTWEIPPEDLEWEKRNAIFNQTSFCGFQQDIFHNPTVESRFQDMISYNGTFDFSQHGIYINHEAQNIFNVSVGDNLTIGVLQQIYEYNESTHKDTVYNYTYNFIDLPILGIFSIFDRDSFSQTCASSRYAISDEDIIIMGNLDYLLTEIQAMQDYFKLHIGENYWPSYQLKVNFGIMADHTAFASMNPNSISNKIDFLSTRINLALENHYEVSSELKQSTMMITVLITIFQVIFTIISLPVIILGWFLCKTNWVLIYQRRRRELALLKIKGGITRQLKNMFRFEAIIVGLVGGILGVLGGNFTSIFVLKELYPPAVANMNFLVIVRQLFTGTFLSTTTLIGGILGGLFISVLAVRKPLKEFAALQPIDGLAKYNESSQNILPKKKLDWFLFFTGLIPILWAMVSQGIIKLGETAYYNPLFLMATTIFTALLPIAPFALVYGSVKLLCRNMKIFSKLIHWISHLFNKKISVFTSKSILRNQTRSFRLVFIVAMALSFILMASTIESSESSYQNQMTLLDSGGGLRLNVYSENIGIKGPQNLLDYINSTTNQTGISGMNWYFNYQTAGGYYYMEDTSNSIIGGISASNYNKFIPMYDSWFIDMTAKEAMEKLINIPNSTLIPESMIEDGYQVGENISKSYQAADGTTEKEIKLLIVGVYKALPMVSSDYWQRVIIIDNGTISDGKISNYNPLNLIVYPKTGNVDDLDINIISDAIEGWAPGISVYQPWSMYGSDELTMANALVKFLNLEGIYLIAIVSFGIAIIMYISVNEKAHDFGLLRARGVPKKVIYKIQISEGLTLILTGALFTFIGIIGGASMILQINGAMQMGDQGGVTRALIIPWLKILWQLALSGAIFIISIIFAVALETRKSNVAKIGELLRVE
ncbi:MAG: ABC transporter permease [Promethearchaeota archaeon]